MPADLQQETVSALQDLHARESMRLGWYRQTPSGGTPFIQQLRARKAQHQAFLTDLLRRRELKPAWYSRYYYYAGHLFGLVTALLPLRWVAWIERTLEYWIFLRYEQHLRRMRLHVNIRSMVEAVQLRKLDHNEPAPDVLSALEQFHSEQKQLLAANA